LRITKDEDKLAEWSRTKVGRWRRQVEEEKCAGKKGERVSEGRSSRLWVEQPGTARQQHVKMAGNRASEWGEGNKTKLCSRGKQKQQGHEGWERWTARLLYIQHGGSVRGLLPHQWPTGSL
jgi:hypothetical protein